MYQIKTFNAIAPEGLAIFNNHYEINKNDDADAYLIRSVDLHEHQFPKKLKVIARAGAGFNNIPLDKATKQGIAVFTTPGSNANAVKELVIAMLVAASRNLFAAAAYSAQNSGADISLRAEKDKTKFNGTELFGKTLAVIGVGHVGSLVANAANTLGMKVIGYDPYLSADAAWQISTDINRADTFGDAIKDADFVTIHVPKNSETTNMINTQAIAAMKPGATLLNFARGGIVDNQAVIDALNTGQLHSYMTDFGDDLLLNRDDIVITPHIGGSTAEAEVNGATKGATTIINYLETGNVHDSVNLPSLSVPFNTAYRITIIHENIPNMVGQITTALANENINIESMSNAAKAQIAYNIIDTNHLREKQVGEVVTELNKISSVYRTRVIEK